MASEFEDEPPRKKGRVQQETSEHCPYLAEINRKLLDFDFEKLCSVSLSNLNVYGCLCCGKYFQGARVRPFVAIPFHSFSFFLFKCRLRLDSLRPKV
jgi:hypothetical protein